MLRVILIPQGEFVTYGALSCAMLATGRVPSTVKRAVAMGLVAFALGLFFARAGRMLAGDPLGRASTSAFPAWRCSASSENDAGRSPAQNAVAVNIALALLIVAAIRAVPLPHRVPADRAHLDAGAPADRL